MKNSVIILAILFIYSLAIFGQDPLQSDRIILKLKNDTANPGKSLCEQNLTGNKKIDSLNKIFRFITIKKQSLGRKSNKHIYIIQFPEGTNLKHVIDEYYKTGEIEYAEPDYPGTLGAAPGVTPDDYYYYLQWALKNDGTFPLAPSVTGADMDMENAWDIEQGDSNIIVGIIDTGVKLDHPELEGRIWQNYDEIPDNAIDDDTNGFVDDVRGWDFANSDNDPVDGHGHGTNITGIIGANANNSIGYAGVDWNCKLMIIKAFKDNGSGTQSMWANAVYYAVDNGAKVINMSFGTTNPTMTFQDAITYALDNNVVLVACMMNTNSNTIFYPAGFPGVIAVGSTNPDDTRSHPFPWDPQSGSNFGSHISVVAPGNYIFGLDYQSNTNYSVYYSGTSQATAHVSGLASLLLAQDPDRTPAQIKSIIEATAEDTVGDPVEDTPGWDQYYGYGRINAFNALYLITGINPVNSRHQTSFVFPNPTSGKITIEFLKFAFPGHLSILNLNGQELLQQTIFEPKTQIDINSLPSGVYFVRLTNDSAVEVCKMVKY
jgi:thermitase